MKTLWAAVYALIVSAVVIVVMEDIYETKILARKIRGTQELHTEAICSLFERFEMLDIVTVAPDSEAAANAEAVREEHDAR